MENRGCSESCFKGDNQSTKERVFASEEKIIICLSRSDLIHGDLRKNISNSHIEILQSPYNYHQIFTCLEP